jgi:hypothetical protein
MEELLASPMIFSGRIISTRVVPPSKDSDSFGFIEMVVQPDHVWKGTVTPRVTVTTGNHTCGLQGVRLGETFVFFISNPTSPAVGKGSVLMLRRPDGTEVGSARKELEEKLGPGQAIQAPPEPSPPSRHPQTHRPMAPLPKLREYKP